MTDLFFGHGWKIFLEQAVLPDGRTKEMARVQRADSVHLLAFPTNDTMLLLREYRPYYGTYIWMLPSGKVDKESDITVAAQRELQEETGFRAEELTYYCTTNNSEGLISANHYFIARDLVHDSLPQDAEELIEVHTVTLEDALGKILSSEKVHTPSAFGVLRYMREYVKV